MKINKEQFQWLQESLNVIKQDIYYVNYKLQQVLKRLPLKKKK